MSTPGNILAPVLTVAHSSLERADPSSTFKSVCPVCKDGMLLVFRDRETLQVLPEDRCVRCGQEVYYTDHQIGGVAVRRDEPRPKKKKDWEGRRVRLRHELRNKGGDLFRAGEVMEVRRNFGGLELQSLHNCDACHHGRFRVVKHVHESSVDLLPRSLSRMADSRDPSLILIAVRKVLVDGLAYYEHDGHSLPKKVVRDALAVLGVPEEKQP